MESIKNIFFTTWGSRVDVKIERENENQIIETDVLKSLIKKAVEDGILIEGELKPRQQYKRLILK